jgi:hypothetical protein
MFEQYAARIVNKVDTIDDLAMGMPACKLAVYVTSSLAVRFSLVDTRKFGVESWGFS